MIEMLHKNLVKYHKINLDLENTFCNFDILEAAAFGQIELLH